MDERAPTRRRFYYSINEVQLLMRCAAQLQRNATASILGVLGLLSSAPELWRFSFFVICFCAGAAAFMLHRGGNDLAAQHAA